MLESYIKKCLEKKDILLMTHIVLGYPSVEESYDIIGEMVKAGVSIMELQIPFSEPTADGPVIVKANQMALDKGSNVKKCFEIAEKASESFDIPFLIMTYFNIVFKYGTENFARVMEEKGLKGAIVPDLPPEEGEVFYDIMGKHGLDPIMLYSPTTTLSRMQYINLYARGFIYCVARKGVTGQHTDFSQDLLEYLKRCRKATNLPLALGFGVKDKKDIDFLKGKAEIAVIGSQTIRIMEEKGIEAVGDFIHGLI